MKPGAIARELYLQKKDMEAGRILARAIPLDCQPQWVAQLLECVSHQCPVPDAVHQLIAIAPNPVDWPEARRLFDQLRQDTLATEKAPHQFSRHYVGVLLMAENAAKVTYNSTRGAAPYDSDCAWWLPGNVRYLLENSEYAIDANLLLSCLFTPYCD